MTGVGEWGPWIVGGAWLEVRGRKVDLLYRCIESVAEVVDECRSGVIRMDYQPGHPHGFCSAIWMGEVALCRPLHDPEGALAALKERTVPYPDALRRALVRRFFWEVSFAIENAKSAEKRRDATYVAGCAYRSLCCMAQTLFALNRRYLINEKGALREAARFPIAIPDVSQRTCALWQAVGTGDLAAASENLWGLQDDLARLVESEDLG